MGISALTQGVNASAFARFSSSTTSLTRSSLEASFSSGREARSSRRQDDQFLTEGQVTEEEIGSVDYDVWVTEDHDDTLILRYAARFSKYTKCPECRYITYFLSRTRIVRHATYSSTGKKEVIHQCKHCNYRKVSYKTIPRKTRSSSSSIGGGFRGGFSGGGGSSSWGGGSSGGGGAGVSW